MSVLSTISYLLSAVSYFAIAEFGFKAGLNIRVIETFPEFLLFQEKWDALVDSMEFPH